MNFRNIIIVVIILFFSSVIFANEINYRVSDIPLQLKENAKAVIRYESIDFEVFSTTKAIQKVKFAITILNKNGIRNSIFLEFYDKFSKISKIRGTVYNEQGVIIKKIKPDEIFDHSAISGYTLYQDNRLKLIDPQCRTFPFTVEYSYEIEYTGYLNYPEWRPFKDFNISVQESIFRVSAPIGSDFRYLERNLRDSCKITIEDKNYIYFWQAKSLKAELIEDFSRPVEEYLPIVYAAPSNIEFGGYKGNFESWQNFGKWIQQLNEGKDEINSETDSFLFNLVKNTENDLDKIKILYDYLQNKVRYVSIQVGIGGWQPFDASIVDEYSYGDCKALSNYMKSILKVVGIKSYYTLIRAGKDEPQCITEFPSNQFNHAILCVPVKYDTVWLECTSQNIPFGYLGTFTDDREALLITDSGGVIVHTPILTLKDNIKSTKAILHLEKDGINSQAEISIKYSGMFYDEMQQFIHSDDTDQKQFIEENISTQGSRVLSYNINEKKTENPYLNFELSLEINKVSNLVNNRIIAPINPFNKIGEIPLKSDERKSDLLVKRSYQTNDTIIFLIPENLSIEQIPQEQSISSSFGNYYSQIIKSDQSLYFIRKMEIYKGSYPAEEYDKFITFFESIEKCDKDKFILREKK